MFAFKSDIGKIRERNEDSTCIIENDNNDFFMLVFDGMGGHKKGDVASRLAEQNMVKEFKQKKKFYGKLDMYFWLKKLVKNTNKLLNKYSIPPKNLIIFFHLIFKSLLSLDFVLTRLTSSILICIFFILFLFSISKLFTSSNIGINNALKGSPDIFFNVGGGGGFVPVSLGL